MCACRCVGVACMWVHYTPLLRQGNVRCSISNKTEAYKFCSSLLLIFFGAGWLCGTVIGSWPNYCKFGPDLRQRLGERDSDSLVNSSLTLLFNSNLV